MFDTTSMLTPYLRKADTTAMLLPYFRDADTTSLNLVSRFATKLNISDTALMLTNYLRLGVAASTYLPLTGGTLTGALSGTTGTFTNLNIVNPSTEGILTLQGADNNTATRIQFKTGNEIRKQIVLPTSDSNLEFRTSTIGGTQGGYSFYTRRNLNAEQLAFNIDLDGNSNFYGTLGVTGAATFNNTSRFIGNVAINTTTAYKPLEVHSNENDFISLGVKPLNIGKYSGIHFGYVEPNTDYRKSAIVFQRRDYTSPFDASGSIHILNTAQGQGGRSADLRDARLTIMNNANVGINDTLPTSTLSVNGTLAVTSTTTLSGALTVNNTTVLNEGSGDFDTRIESDGNANMVFVDAGQDRVGIGTGSPSKTLDINGEVRIATVTATPTALLGKDGSNVVGEVTDINQSGVMKVGSTTQNTSSVGIINVAHGLSYTPTKVIATIAQQSSYVIVCHGITSTNLNFTIYDSTDGTALDNVSVGFFWIAFK
jgi:hypothetical protein